MNAEPRTRLILSLALALLTAAWLPLCAAAPVRGAFEPETDYSVQMLEAVLRRDGAAGAEAQRLRDEKLAAMGLDYPVLRYAELDLLSRLIAAEAGSTWLDRDWRMAVGEVALNRVASPEFPDTLEEVISQPGQYPVICEKLPAVVPDRESAEAALALLMGQRVLDCPAVVYQANFVLGGGVYLERRDKLLGTTYFCLSEHPEQYEIS